MLEVDVPDHVWRSLQPGRVRRAYLSHWIDHNLPTRLLPVSAVIKLGFTLPRHDRATDALRATARLYLQRAEAEKVAAELQRTAADASVVAVIS